MRTPGSLYPMFRIDKLEWVTGRPTGRWELRWLDVFTKWEMQVLYIEVEVAHALNVAGSNLFWVKEDDIKFCREKFRFPEDYLHHGDYYHTRRKRIQ